MSTIFSKILDNEQKNRTRVDRPPDLGEMSLAEIGLAVKSQLLAPRSEPADVGGKLRFAAQRPRAVEGDIERHSHLSALVLPHSG